MSALPPLEGLSATNGALLKLAYIKAETPYQRELLGAYGRVVIELARCVMELERAQALTFADTLARYASEVTDIACEHVRMSAEIQRQQDPPQ